ncbi:ferritin-like domain-containing protein, partial [Candidatus Pacearchaeota archaeon]|nr:ferritin-like domain-containing protein [Candidatus Pacearchaeota archaeon]
MNELVALLEEIVRAEYAQWMRYVYLSSLSYGLNTDALVSEFEKHAEEEYEHAKLISRWIVDLDGIPPTDTPPVEQFCGTVDDAIGWLLEAEIEGARLYSLTFDAASLIGMHGLTHDIGRILSEEHEHISDLENFVAPHMLSGGDTTLIVVAQAFKRYANNIELFNKCSQVAAKEDYQINQYLKDILELAKYHYVQEYTPKKGHEYVLNDVERTVTDLWQRRKEEDVRSALQFYKYLYDWITSPDVVSRWTEIHNSYMPDWETWKLTDWYEEAPKEISFQDIMQQVSPEMEAPVQPEQAPAKAQPPPPPQEVVEEERRPITKSIEEKIKVSDSKPPYKQQFDVGVGDRIRNMDPQDEDIPAPGRPGRTQATVGTIEKIED